MNYIRIFPACLRICALVLTLSLSVQQEAACQVNSAEHLFQQAQQLRNAEKNEEAKQAIAEAVRIAPENDIYSNYLSWCDYLTGNYVEGINIGIRSLELNPTVPSYYNCVGLNAYGNQDFAIARKYFRLGADISIRYQDRVHYDEANVYLKLLRERTFTVTWQLDPTKGRLKDGYLSLPVPTTHLPYQDAKFQVTGVAEFQVLHQNGNDILRVQPKGNMPIQLILTVTTRPFSLKNKVVGPQFPPDISLSKAYLGTSSTINPNSYAVQSVFRQIGRANTDVEQIRRITVWLRKNIRYQIPHDYKSVDEIISRKWTECGGFSDLFTALCRASKIPARQVWGVIDDGGQFAPLGHLKGHVWAEFYLSTVGWVPVEPQSLNNIGSLKTDYIRICHCDVIANSWPTDDLWGMAWDMPSFKEAPTEIME